MEGIYFFGEHVRWNLGWNNPNQAGVFIAMWIPWLWALGSWLAGGVDAGAGRLRRDAAATLALAVELGLWFLLCKTYSRGALVAAVGSGLVFLVWRYALGIEKSYWKWVAARVAGIAILLLFTGLFSRIEPRFVSQDASAGNRLSLWHGGIRMIAASPWEGWGVGNSGPAFMHWFQDDESNEAYAGMVNSYLHVGVERGLPVLAGVIALAGGVLVAGFLSSHKSTRGRSFLMAAGCSWLVFLIANGFSTLWIFKNLWWLPGIAFFGILGTVCVVQRKGILPIVVKSFGFSTVLAVMLAASLALAGRLMTKEQWIVPSSGAEWISLGKPDDGAGGATMFLPDASVLGETWGKEVRRLAHEMDRPCIRVAAKAQGGEDLRYPGDSPEWIIACGNQVACGFALQKQFPKAGLILVHPLGRPRIPDGFIGKVTVILPSLDTSGHGRLWKVACRKQGWSCLTSPGVGQDIRQAWPEGLIKVMEDK